MNPPNSRTYHRALLTNLLARAPLTTEAAAAKRFPRSVNVAVVALSWTSDYPLHTFGACYECRLGWAADCGLTGFGGGAQ